ncbi:molybdopterin-dependent oxidoreductase [Sphingomonas sp. CL5.1]|uniref:molybdopterin-containing oxidoreductase family protein n=1 Tax=Sphingomonas sp. CL5.1 TaxID=2653203 RepID=UPI001583A9FC|nr:molybdopterin-dependent oxidoreductase [Sphingomonas sp. CL5.1]QKR98392.1 molybdopterin-dependent oxidoreductase [Sphingomonas sp. CL5.1]
MAAEAIVTRPGADGRHPTFCRLCESFCGLVATVEGGRVTAVAPDRDNPHSIGHACVKGIRIADVTNDPDRVLRPLKRVGGPGEFAPVSWAEALDDIAARLRAIRERHGGGALAGYLGNPTAFSTNSFMGFGEFVAAIGAKKLYGAGSQDSNARLTANYMIHGAPVPLAFADLPQCDFLLILGANPMVSNGWMIFDPRWRHDLEAIAARGRVVVVDPRATETARRGEHVAINPDSDAWLLAGMLHVLFAEDRIDRAAVAAVTTGLPDLEQAVRAVPLAAVGAATGIPVDTIAALARDFAGAERAAVYGGLGLCRGRFGTFGSYLASVLNAVTGRYGAPGGVRFGRQLFGGAFAAMAGGYSDNANRVGGVPAIAGKLAAALLPADIEEEGDRIRALIVSAGNPVVSAPGGARLAAALEKLELHVSLDFYVNETNKHAHYVLPTLTFLERADWPLVGMHALMRPFLQYTEAVVPPMGEARDDYAIYAGIARRMGLDAPSLSPRKQALGRFGLLPDPLGQVDRMLRRGPVGDHFGERDGWSRARLRDRPHGVMLDDMPEDRHRWRARVAHPGGRLDLWHPLAAPELARLRAGLSRPAGTLVLIGRRDIRSINSWMHNSDKLVRSQHPTLMIHPEDAAARDIADGDEVRVSNANGAIRVPAEITDGIARGTVSYPHGWGHAGGWQRANATEGRNVNVLLGLGVEWVEWVSGMTLLDCLDVEVTRVATKEAA